MSKTYKIYNNRRKRYISSHKKWKRYKQQKYLYNKGYDRYIFFPPPYEVYDSRYINLYDYIINKFNDKGYKVLDTIRLGHFNILRPNHIYRHKPLNYLYSPDVCITPTIERDSNVDVLELRLCKRMYLFDIKTFGLECCKYVADEYVDTIISAYKYINGIDPRIILRYRKINSYSGISMEVDATIEYYKEINQYDNRE